ncbi:hypothetical protein [Saccharococcus thermophilus]|uniref:Uncharacterized protein n=1 Tax=Saccharococcus thermophilus TaxID=29396 RepID=A0A846MM05_9BACL|nr:hypothetical protein [Saccharococcus thermophilus]NIK16615.1 hypothetical protein [Saccharococcus thermophilus]
MGGIFNIPKPKTSRNRPYFERFRGMFFVGGLVPCVGVSKKNPYKTFFLIALFEKEKINTSYEKTSPFFGANFAEKVAFLFLEYKKMAVETTADQFFEIFFGKVDFFGLTILQSKKEHVKIVFLSL